MCDRMGLLLYQLLAHFGVYCDLADQQTKKQVLNVASYLYVLCKM